MNSALFTDEQAKGRMIMCMVKAEDVEVGQFVSRREFFLGVEGDKWEALSLHILGWGLGEGKCDKRVIVAMSDGMVIELPGDKGTPQDQADFLNEHKYRRVPKWYALVLLATYHPNPHEKGE